MQEGVGEHYALGSHAQQKRYVYGELEDPGSLFAWWPSHKPPAPTNSYITDKKLQSRMLSEKNTRRGRKDFTRHAERDFTTKAPRCWCESWTYCEYLTSYRNLPSLDSNENREISAYRVKCLWKKTQNNIIEACHLTKRLQEIAALEVLTWASSWI